MSGLFTFFRSRNPVSTKNTLKLISFTNISSTFKSQFYFSRHPLKALASPPLGSTSLDSLKRNAVFRVKLCAVNLPTRARDCFHQSSIISWLRRDVQFLERTLEGRGGDAVKRSLKQT